MKIITNNAVYVQMGDLMFLNQTDLPIPASIFVNFGGNNMTIVDDNNRYEFIKFEDESEIDYFKNLDWIVDYNVVKDLNKKQVKNLVREIAEEENTIAKKFNSLPEEEKEENMDMVSKYEQLEYKRYGIRDILLFKQGRIEMSLPEEVDYPANYKTSIKNIKKQLLKSKKGNK